MDLSVIIVNYNVKYFLDQCLASVQKSTKDIDSEIIVVDNNSVDGSCKMVESKYPQVKLIYNKENVGFSKANNQGIKEAKGRYILLLNPDTVVELDTLRKTVNFMDTHPDAGALGVQMVDGKGKYLPESKRGLPTPAVAFYKILGLSSLFPQSKIFGRYHLGFLDRNKTHKVDVLAGAFMLLRKEVLDKIGLLDEDFFMYGEDIDISYRIIKAGYNNYYFPEARIIHYKGESTKKNSINYVFMFYNAMIIFAKKHFSKKNARLFSFLINVAIYFRATLAVLHRFVKKIILPLTDAAIIYSGVYVITEWWGSHVIKSSYPTEFFMFVVPAYIAIWLLSVYLSGGYDKPVKLIKIIQGIVVGTMSILIIYALLPENLRFSRALIIFGAVWGMTAMLGLRLLLHILPFTSYKVGNDKNRRIAVVGDEEEAPGIAVMLGQLQSTPAFIGMITPDNDIIANNNGFIGNMNQLKEIINIYKIDEIIFCAKSVPANKIIDKMSELQDDQVEFHIASSESFFLVGSNSIKTAGDPYIFNINSISKTNNKRNKRFFDFVLAAFMLPLSPVISLFMIKPGNYFKNLLLVIIGKRSWVGYAYHKDFDSHKLPEIKKGIIDIAGTFKDNNIDSTVADRLNMLYARDYHIHTDINLIIKGFRYLGN